MSDLDGIMLAAIRYRSGEGYGQSVEDRAWLLRYIDRQVDAAIQREAEVERLREIVRRCVEDGIVDNARRRAARAALNAK